jgi:dTDP-glucose 4,6-dehydratase
MDFSKIIHDLGHDPKIAPEEGIRRTVAWMKDYYRIR